MVIADSCMQYGGRENESIERSIDSQVAKFVDLIERKYISTSTEFRPLDFSRTAQFFALDVISTLAWGSAFGFLVQDEDINDYLRLFDEYMPAMLLIMSIPGLPWLMQQWPLNKMQPQTSDKAGFGSLMG
jgi:hypothetical protein